MSLLSEFKRRGVFQIAALYVGAAWLILQVVDLLIDRGALPDSAFAVTITVLTIGFPIALILAYIYDWTRHGIVRGKAADSEGLSPAESGRGLDFVIIAILVAAVLLFAFDKWGPNAAPEHSVAVLPFANLSGLEEEQYFADGLTVVILGALARQPKLRVPPRGVVFHSKFKEMDSVDAARALGVRHLLEGSVQRSGTRLRLAVQLTEADTGFQEWSDVIDRDLTDIFDVQDSIARQVLKSVLPMLAKSGESKVVVVSTKDLDAYDLYLRALEQKNIASFESLAQAEALLRQALAIDPSFAEAMVELAMTYEVQGWTGYINLSEANAKIDALIHRALLIDPQHPSALILDAFRNWELAVKSDDKAEEEIVLAENSLRQLAQEFPDQPQIYYRLAIVERRTNNSEKAVEFVDKALALDRQSARLFKTKADWQRIDGDLKGAWDSINRAIELRPDWPSVYLSAGWIEGLRGHYAEELSLLLRTLALDPQDHGAPAWIAGRLQYLGMYMEAQGFAERSLSMVPSATYPNLVSIRNCLLARDFECAAIRAEEFIRSGFHDDSDHLFGEFLRAYLSAMIALGKPDDALDFFESMWPGVTAADVPDRLIDNEWTNGQGMLVLIAMMAAGDEEQAVRFLESRASRLDQIKPDWRETWRSYMEIYLVVAGDFEGLVAYEFERLTAPRDVRWLQRYVWLEPLLSDPRIAKRVAELDAEAAASAVEIRKVLAEFQFGDTDPLE